MIGLVPCPPPPLFDWAIPRHIKRGRLSQPDLTLPAPCIQLAGESRLCPVADIYRTHPRLSPGVSPVLRQAKWCMRYRPRICACGSQTMLLQEELNLTERLEE